VKRRVIATLVAIPTTVVLLISPLVACGCLEPWQELLADMGAESPFSKTNLNAKALDLAAKKKYLGQPIGILIEIKTRASIQCADNVAYVFDCTYWISRGVVRETGFRVVATAGPRDEIKTIQVAPESRYFGRWRQ
jgi:hypothetical protein